MLGFSIANKFNTDSTCAFFAHTEVIQIISYYLLIRSCHMVALFSCCEGGYTYGNNPINFHAQE